MPVHNMQLGNVSVSPFCPKILTSKSIGEKGIPLNPEGPYEFEVPVKKSKLLLHTFIASILAYVFLVEEPSPGLTQNLIHLLVRH